MNVLQAAEADLMRRYRNQGSSQRGAYEPYAFQRDHVRRAKTIEQLIRTALMEPLRGLKSKKKNTRLLYGDGGLLVAALHFLERTNA